ncbi:MAG TPA: glycosyltransferase family 4 protein [Opitutales bacterium]|nr:glycosyltransferase family 4 protein [Opitutales bacterium]
MINKRPIRVLIVAPTQGRYGGLEAFVFALAASLAGQEGFSPKLCFKLVHGASLDETLRARCEKLGGPIAIVQRGSQALFNNLRWADVVHAQNPSPDVAWGAQLAGRPLVMTIINHRSTRASAHNFLWGRAVRLAQERCYISDFVRETWEPRGLRRHSQVFPAVSSLPPAGPVQWERKGLLFVGRWIANKGIEELLEAYATAKIAHAQWPLTLAGDGPLRQKVGDIVAQRGLGTVRLAGFVSEEEKFSLMTHAKWNVAPPHTREDLGLTPIEARHLAVPSIITRDGGLPEAAGLHALVADPGDVISLRARIEEAAAMPEDEYRRRALGAQAGLAKFLRPLSDYYEIYRRLAWWCV